MDHIRDACGCTVEPESMLDDDLDPWPVIPIRISAFRRTMDPVQKDAPALATPSDDVIRCLLFLTHTHGERRTQ